MTDLTPEQSRVYAAQMQTMTTNERLEFLEQSGILSAEVVAKYLLPEVDTRHLPDTLEGYLVQLALEK